MLAQWWLIKAVDFQGRFQKSPAKYLSHHLTAASTIAMSARAQCPCTRRATPTPTRKTQCRSSAIGQRTTFRTSLQYPRSTRATTYRGTAICQRIVMVACRCSNGRAWIGRIRCRIRITDATRGTLIRVSRIHQKCRSGNPCLILSWIRQSRSRGRRGHRRWGVRVLRRRWMKLIATMLKLKTGMQTQTETMSPNTSTRIYRSLSDCNLS